MSVAHFRADLPADYICAQEPIRIPGAIQPHGALFVIEPASGTILQHAIGDPRLSHMGESRGRKLADLLPAETRQLVEDIPDRLRGEMPVYLGYAGAPPLSHHVLAHQSDDVWIVELESATPEESETFSQIYPNIREFLETLEGMSSIDQCTALAARHIRQITRLDRVLVYRFDDDWNGEVIAEDRNDRLPSYLGLRFPASDIPAQARELYRRNRMRLIGDANYAPAPLEPALNPLTGRPVDLSFAALRSVSPVHLQYMRNMGTLSSMSISLVVDGRLWGLVSCHNSTPLNVSYHVRTACDFVGQILSMQIDAREATRMADRRNALRTIQTRLLASMAAADHFILGLIENADDLIALTNASGVAIVAGGSCTLRGITPSQESVMGIVAWLAQRGGDVFHTDRLPEQMPDAEVLKDEASGLLAISISQIHESFVLWFRRELVHTVDWGGDPRKTGVRDEGPLSLHPRASFESWQETVRLTSEPWHRAEIDAASELRTAIVDIVLRKVEELAVLSERLMRTNKELEAFSYSISHDLRAPFRHIVGYAQLLKKYEGEKLSDRGLRYLATIIESALSAGTLVDDLLSFSQIGRTALTPVTVDMNVLTREVIASLTVEQDAHEVEWRVGPLKPIRGDPMMVRLLMQNLIDNALKFSRQRNPAIITIKCEERDRETVFSVSDNGVGFDMAYVGKLFGVFQRLHRVEEFEGTGIGLANVKRIVDRHGGRIWAESAPGEGATFHFTLPTSDAA
jgi:chemotaxis family two-component system sensor kinase Cph1